MRGGHRREQVQPRPITTTPDASGRAGKGTALVRFLGTTDPKDIVILYLTTPFGFFVAGGAMAMFIARSWRTALPLCGGGLPLLLGSAHWLAPVAARRPVACGNAWPLITATTRLAEGEGVAGAAGELDPDGFGFEVGVDGLGAVLAAEPGLLVPAEWH